ncbi:MAG: GNAT family N-acetyltransferase [Clostridia bacterium]|nr:GNAT family N-acetyltransferase [Clostridia bacterium]
MNISFRKTEVNDAYLIRNWIKTNRDVKHWYYMDKIPRLDTIKNKIANRLNDKKFNMVIVMCDDTEIGYIQSYPVEGNGAWINKVKIYDNMVSIDYFIGDVNYIHKGLGVKMILAYINKYLKNNIYDYALITPDPENIASNRCAIKCGFEYIKTVNIPYNNSKNKESIFIKKLQ